MEHCSKFDNYIRERLKWHSMEPGKILEELLDKKTLAVLRLFSSNPDKQYYLREIAKATRVPIATVFRIVRHLVTMSVVAEIKIKKFKIYQYGSGKESKFVDQLIEVRRGAVEEFFAVLLTVYCRLSCMGRSSRIRRTCLLLALECLQNHLGRR